MDRIQQVRADALASAEEISSQKAQEKAKAAEEKAKLKAAAKALIDEAKALAKVKAAEEKAAAKALKDEARALAKENAKVKGSEEHKQTLIKKVQSIIRSHGKAVRISTLYNYIMELKELHIYV